MKKTFKETRPMTRLELIASSYSRALEKINFILKKEKIDEVQFVLIKEVITTHIHEMNEI